MRVMKKFFTLFALLVLSMSASAQVFVPGERVSEIQENTKYFIFNTTYTPGTQYDKRWGFVYYDGDVKTYGGAVPETFTTSDESYLFTFSSNGDGTYTLTNVGLEEEVGSMFTLTPWMDADDDIKGNAQVRNDDGTYTPNEEISEADKVWVIDNGDGSDKPYWNGNNWTTVGANCFALWNKAHPYAIYTCIEKNTVTVLYSLYGPDESFIKSEEVEQVPNSDVVIPDALLEDCGYSNLGYDFTTSQTTIGEESCEIEVKITLKEGVVTDLSQLSNNKTYTLTTRRGTLDNNETKVTTNTTGENFKNFAIITYEDAYYLYSADDSKWVKFDGTVNEDIDGDIAENSKLVITTEEVRGEMLPLFFMGIGENGLNTNAGGHVAVNSWVTRDDGNEFVIIESGEFDPTDALAALSNFFNPTCWVSYVVKDEAGKVLFEAKDIPATEGQHITTLPAAYQRSLFYEYNEIDVTVSGTNTTAEFTATQKEDAPFKFTTDKTAPIWYNLKLKDQYYPTYDEYGDPNVTLPSDLADDATTQWAFIGSPYDGFKIVNNAAGTNLVLGSESAAEDENTGANTYATLAEEGTQTFEVWTIQASSYLTNGFFIRNPENHALNQRSTYDLAYWTGGADKGSTFTATKILGAEEELAEAQHLLEELTAGAEEVKIGYPNAEALAEFKAALDNIAESYKMGLIDDDGMKEELKDAIAAVKEPSKIEYTPRTDVYYTITNARGSVIYNPEKAEYVDADAHEFLWYTNSLDKDDPNHQWGFYQQGEHYYLYNVGKKLFANVTTVADPESTKSFYADGCWMFSNKPSKAVLDAGEEDWVTAPAVRVQAECVVTEGEDEYESSYTMSISPSYTGPIITYDGINDGGVPMTFALATSEQDPEVTAAIEELLDPDGIEVINGQTTVNNGAIYNLQGQRVNKAQKGVYIINNKKVVVK